MTSVTIRMLTVWLSFAAFTCAADTRPMLNGNPIHDSVILHSGQWIEGMASVALAAMSFILLRGGPFTTAHRFFSLQSVARSRLSRPT